jgi:hypothetical protein
LFAHVIGERDVDRQRLVEALMKVHPAQERSLGRLQRIVLLMSAGAERDPERRHAERPQKPPILPVGSFASSRCIDRGPPAEQMSVI